MSPAKREELRKFIDQNLAKGFIRPASLPHAALVLLLCMDYLGLNAVSMSNAYPLLLIKDLLGVSAKGKLFMKLDLQDAYFRVCIKEGDKWKIAFNTPLGQFEYLVIPLGLQPPPPLSIDFCCSIDFYSRVWCDCLLGQCVDLF